MKEVFISYSSIDLSQATTVRTVLEKNGISCWMAPRDIPGGSNYTREIPIAIRNCTVFVLILSQNAQNSHWVLKELDSAVNSGKVILPFMLEDCNLNDEFNFLLTGAQRYAAYRKKAEAMETLVSRIRGILGAPSVAKNDPPQETVQEEPRAVPPKAEVKSSVDCFIDARCPVCGGEELKALKGKVKCENLKERLTNLWIPAMALLCMFIGLILSVLVFPYKIVDKAMLFLMLGGLVLGAVWGGYIARNRIKRSRIRNGFSSTCYRCNRCNKVFNDKEPLDN